MRVPSPALPTLGIYRFNPFNKICLWTQQPLNTTQSWLSSAWYPLVEWVASKVSSSANICKVWGGPLVVISDYLLPLNVSRSLLALLRKRINSSFFIHSVIVWAVAVAKEPHALKQFTFMGSSVIQALRRKLFLLVLCAFPFYFLLPFWDEG